VGSFLYPFAVLPGPKRPKEVQGQDCTAQSGDNGAQVALRPFFPLPSFFLSAVNGGMGARILLRTFATVPQNEGPFVRTHTPVCGKWVTGIPSLF